MAIADTALRAGAVLRRRREPVPRSAIRRVLLLRLERIGDLMMSLPAIRALRTLVPHATINLVTGSWNEPLARLIPGIDSIETLDARWLSRDAGGLGMAALAQRARAWRGTRYDLGINLEADIRSNLLLALSGARWKAGFAAAGGGPVLDHVTRFDLAAHTATNGVRLISEALGESPQQVPSPSVSARESAAMLSRDQLAIPAQASARADQLLQPGHGGSHSFVGIQVGAGRAIKEWPSNRLADVANRVSSRFGATIVLTGSEEDRGAAREVISHLNPSTAIINLVGELDLVTLAAVFNRLSVLITPDTGPMHIAAILDTPLVAVFGPSTPERWGPLSERCRIVRVDLPCSPCNRIRRPPVRCTGHTPDCLDAIPVEDVSGAVESLLARADGQRKVRT